VADVVGTAVGPKLAVELGPSSLKSEGVSCWNWGGAS
jgi:hypothetical protein